MNSSTVMRPPRTRVCTASARSILAHCGKKDKRPTPHCRFLTTPHKARILRIHGTAHTRSHLCVAQTVCRHGQARRLGQARAHIVCRAALARVLSFTPAEGAQPVERLAVLDVIKAKRAGERRAGGALLGLQGLALHWCRWCRSERPRRCIPGGAWRRGGPALIPVLLHRARSAASVSDVSRVAGAACLCAWRGGNGLDQWPPPPPP